MNVLLAGLFMKRVCIMGAPVPGPSNGSTHTPTLCDTEPTILLVVLVIGAILGGLLIAVLRAGPRRPTPSRGLRTASAQGVANGGPTRREVHMPAQQPTREWRRDLYVRLMAFVDTAMAEVGRTMPDEHSLPEGPPLAPEDEESARLAAELSGVASSRARSAYAAWSQTLFHFGLLARDVAEAGSQRVPEEEYRDDLSELRRTRNSVFELADGLRRQVAEELIG